jgi:hypothetical protein
MDLSTAIPPAARLRHYFLQDFYLMHHENVGIQFLAQISSRASKSFSGPTVRFSMITFGSLPIATPQLTPFLFSTHWDNQRSVVLSVVNVFDLVKRADRTYVRSLVEFFRVICNGEGSDEGTDDARNAASSIAAETQSMSIPNPRNPGPRDPPIQTPGFWSMGKLLLLSEALTMFSREKCIVTRRIDCREEIQRSGSPGRRVVGTD